MAGERLGVGDRGFDKLGLLEDVSMFFFIGARDAEQDAAKAWASITIGRRKIGSSIERPAIGGKERGKRPSALAAHGLHGDLVAAVDVGALVAVDLYGNEVLVHNLRDFGIVVGFAIHDMAPVAPDGSDIEQHGLVRGLGGGERFVAPLAPLNGLMH